VPQDSQVWQALLRAKGLTVAELALRLRTTRQHAHRLLTGRRSADARREDIDRALALGRDRTGSPAYALAVLSADGEVDLLPAGDTQPLFRDRDSATRVATALGEGSDGVFVVPVWPDYAWRKLVAFHAAWGSDAQPRSVFLVDESDPDLPTEVLLDELHRGFVETLRLRAAADDPKRLRDIETRFAELIGTLVPERPAAYELRPQLEEDDEDDHEDDPDENEPKGEIADESKPALSQHDLDEAPADEVPRDVPPGSVVNRLQPWVDPGNDPVH
jgi:hypothetical protein